MVNSTKNALKWQKEIDWEKFERYNNKQKFFILLLLWKSNKKLYENTNSNNNIDISRSNDHHNGLTKNKIHNEMNNRNSIVAGKYNKEYLNQDLWYSK